MTPRLKKCFAAGSAQALFPLLKDWSADDLRALLADTEGEFCEAQAKMEGKHKELAFHPENFFSRERSKAIDQGRQDAEIEVLGMLAEISSVALYYLRRLAPELRCGTGEDKVTRERLAEWRDPKVWGPLEEALRRAPNEPRRRLVDPGLRPILHQQARICSCGCGRPVRSGNLYAGRGCNSANRALTPAIIRQRLAEGASITEIAEEFGAARWTVYRRIRQMRKERDD